MPDVTPTFSARRAKIVIVAIGALLAGMIFRVAYLQTYGRQRTFPSADRQQHQSVVLPARRGPIVDTHSILMAGTVQTQTVFIDPKFIQEAYQEDGRTPADLEQALTKLAAIIDSTPADLQKLLSDRSRSRYVRIADNVGDDAAAAIAKLDLPGVGFTAVNHRYYPLGSSAAHLLGGTGADGHGLDGVELSFDKYLFGHDGSKCALKDAHRRDIGVAADDYRPPEHGRPVVLTIDANIQLIAEEQLAEACMKNEAKRGEVVVMDPYTGAILALANWPTFNPQNLADSTAEVRCDKAVVWPFEPGSIIKPFIAGPALDWNITHVDDLFTLHGAHYTTPYGRHITDVHGYDRLILWDVLVKSSNIGMSMLGERMGNPNLHKALALFNFGKPTGIELPGEEGGKLIPLPRWTKYSTESVSQGYELMVTPLQICRAFCVYANGGYMVRPHLLKGVIEPDGRMTVANATAADRWGPILDAQSVADMRRILCDVVIRGTAAHTESQTYNIFGKTGTAHLPDGHGGYSLDRFNSSFIAGAPYENPRLVVAMLVHEPNKSIAHYGGTVSAPSACKLLERALAYLQVPPSPDLPVPDPHIASLLYAFDPHEYPSHAIASAQP